MFFQVLKCPRWSSGTKGAQSSQDFERPSLRPPALARPQTRIDKRKERTRCPVSAFDTRGADSELRETRFLNPPGRMGDHGTEILPLVGREKAEKQSDIGEAASELEANGKLLPQVNYESCYAH